MLEQGKIFLYMTLVINIWIVYVDYEDSVGGGGPETWYQIMLAWPYFDNLLKSFFGVQAGIACLMCARELLNSRVADDLESVELPYMDQYDAIKSLSVIISTVRNTFYVLQSSWWRVAIVCCSLAGTDDVL